MEAAWFAEHLREELVLHRWDIVGDDGEATQALAEPWMTGHNVAAVGRPLLARGAAELAIDPRIEGRLRTSGTDDVVVAAGPDSTSISCRPPEGPATLECDAAARVLLLWGRRPSGPDRWSSDAGPDARRAVRTLLSGY